MTRYPPSPLLGEIRSIWLKPARWSTRSRISRVQSNLDIFAAAGLYLLYFHSNHYYAAPHAHRTRGLPFNPVRYKLGGIASPCSPVPSLSPSFPLPSSLSPFSLARSCPVVRNGSPLFFFFATQNPHALPAVSRKGCARGWPGGPETRRRTRPGTHGGPGEEKTRARKHGGTESKNIVGSNEADVHVRGAKRESNRGKEISSVNGENPYPGSNDRGWTRTGPRGQPASQRERNRGRGRGRNVGLEKATEKEGARLRGWRRRRERERYP